MVRRLLCLLFAVVGMVCLALPGIASADGLSGYKVKLTGWPTDQAGTSVAVGDVNGDGIPDYVIGDPTAGANGRSGSGSVYVVYGQKGDKTTPRTVDLSQIPLQGQGSSSVGYRIDGWSGGDHFGVSVAVGDLNSDAVGDIVVGDPDATPYGRSQAGNVYVIYGQKGTGTPELDVSHMSASQGTIITGFSGGDLTGTSVAVGKFNAGSVNGCQGASQEESIAIGAPGATQSGQSKAGEVYVIYGTDLDSQPSSIDLNGITAHTGYIIAGSWGGDQLGTAVADGGDANHDCNDSILIGDPNAGPNGEPQSGTVYVVYGTPRGLNPQEYVSSLQQKGQGYRIDGPTSGARYGTSVANAGDIDGDGIPDVIAGAPNWNDGAGEAIVTYGESRANDPDIINTGNLDPATGYGILGHTSDYTFSGTKGTDPGVDGEPLSACPFFTAWAYGRSNYPNPASLTAEGDRAGSTVAGLGDVNGDGVPDVLVSTPGWNNSAGAVSVIYGHRGRNQGYIPLYANGQGLATSVGHTIWDGNIPSPQSHPYGNGNPWDFPFGPAPQILEQTEEAVSGYSYGVNGGWLDCSNYMTEPGDQAGSAVATTATGTGGYAVIGAPTYGTTNHVAFNGTPGNPTVWYDDGRNLGQVGLSAGGPSGEVDWAETAGSGAAYVLSF